MASSLAHKPRKVTATSAREAIRRELVLQLGKKWQVGDRLPPVKELAIQLGAGESNTYLAVRELARDGVLDCRQRRGTYVLKLPAGQSSGMREVPRRGKAALRGKRVAVFQTNIVMEGFIQQMIDAFRLAFDGSGATLESRILPACSSPGPVSFEHPGADAVVLIHPSPNVVFKPARGQHLLIASISSQPVVHRPTNVDVVTVDEHHGGVLAGMAYAGMGHVTPCFIGRAIGPDCQRYDAVSATRLHGFEAGLDQLIDPAHLIKAIGYSLVAGGKAFRRYIKLDRPPRHIFAASDDLALGFIAAAAGQGLRAGHDYQIIGFDGQLRGQTLEEGPMSTIKVPVVEMGKRAAELLIERFNNPSRPSHRLLLDCAFHQGVTTSPLKGTLP